MEEAGDVDGEMDEPESSIRIADGSTTRTSASTSTSGLNPAQNKVTYHQIDRWSAVSP